MLKLLKYLKASEWVQIFICLIFIVSQVYLDLKLPDYMAEITTLVQTPGSDMGKIWTAGGYMMLCALGSLVGAVIVCYIASRISAVFARRIREKVYNKVEGFSMEEFGRFSVSSLLTRSTNDVTQVQMFIGMGIQVILKAPILAIWAICKIAGKSWQWSLTTGIAVFVLVALMAIIVIFALPKFKVIQKLTDNLNKVTNENLSGVRVVRAYNAENYQENKFENANEELTKTNLFVNRLMAIMMPGMTLIMSGLSLAIYWIGAYLIAGAPMGARIGLFADMVVYSAYAMQVVMAFIMLIMIFIILPRAMVSARRINEVLHTESSVLDGDNANVVNGVDEVEFKGVSFKYPHANEYVLHDINFKATKGQTVAFIGSTGSGKSTIINLIPRFYDATEGEVLINGVNIKDYKQSDVHNKIGYISQKPIIFSGDITSNVAFGDNGESEVNSEKLDNAVEVAQAKDFIEKLPEKYDSHVSQGGLNLSGGQKQRVAIARAIYKKPDIYIFDDSFSALDYKTDKKLRDALENEKKNAITFIVAQRIGTIRNADQIVVLESGKVVGIGKHDDLLKTCAIYNEIASSQLSKEELENA